MKFRDFNLVNSRVQFHALHSAPEKMAKCGFALDCFHYAHWIIIHMIDLMTGHFDQLSKQYFVTANKSFLFEIRQA